MKSLLYRPTIAAVAHQYILLPTIRTICGTAHVFSEAAGAVDSSVNSHYACGNASWRDPTTNINKAKEAIVDVQETLNSHYANGNASWRDPSLYTSGVKSFVSPKSEDAPSEPELCVNSHYASGNASWRDPSMQLKKSMKKTNSGHRRSMSTVTNGTKFQTLVRWRGGCDGHHTFHLVEQRKTNNSFSEPGYQINSSFSETGYQLSKRPMSTNSFELALKRHSQPQTRWIGGTEGHRHMSTTTFNNPKARIQSFNSGKNGKLSTVVRIEQHSMKGRDDLESVIFSPPSPPCYLDLLQNRQFRTSRKARMQVILGLEK